MGGEEKATRVWKQSLDYLRNIDIIMSGLIDKSGNKAPLIKIVRDPFETLVRAVIHQNIRAEQSTLRLVRLTELFDGRFPRPGEILTLGRNKLEAIGLSGKQVTSILKIASMVMDNKIDFSNISNLVDEEIITRLSELPGIGRWSAQMFLVFHLKRPDVLMTSDRSLANAAKKVFNLDKVPSETEMESIFEKYRPYRSAAAWFIWRASGGFDPGLH